MIYKLSSTFKNILLRKTEFTKLGDSQKASKCQKLNGVILLPHLLQHRHVKPPDAESLPFSQDRKPFEFYREVRNEMDQGSSEGRGERKSCSNGWKKLEAQQKSKATDTLKGERKQYHSAVWEGRLVVKALSQNRALEDIGTHIYVYICVFESAYVCETGNENLM